MHTTATAAPQMISPLAAEHIYNASLDAAAATSLATVVGAAST